VRIGTGDASIGLSSRPAWMMANGYRVLSVHLRNPQHTHFMLDSTYHNLPLFAHHCRVSEASAILLFVAETWPQDRYGALATKKLTDKAYFAVFSLMPRAFN